MSNRSGIDAALVDLLGEDNQILFMAVKLEFDTETLRLWNGKDNLTIQEGGSNTTYIGAGTLLQISGIEEQLDMSAAGVTISLAGMDEAVLNLALNEEYQNRPISILLGMLSGGTDISAGTMTIFKGRMQSMSIDDNPEGSLITLNAESRLVDLNRPSNLRYTNESQQFISSGDTCFSRVGLLQDKEILWGRAGTSGSGLGGSVGGRNDNVNKRIQRR